MLLHTVYTVNIPNNQTLDIEFPFVLSLDFDTQASLLKREDGIQLSVDRKIDHTNLELAAEGGAYKVQPNGEQKPEPVLQLTKDKDLEHILSQDVISALAFITDTPITLSHPLFQDRFVPETDEDREILERFGTDQPYNGFNALVSMRSFRNPVITDLVIASLMPRRVGLRLYANAMMVEHPVAKFRELWRILEAAFGEGNDKLIALLAKYEPVQKLGFDKVELKRYLVLRDRASHAQSKAGIKELAYVDQECRKQLPRLKNLCERVIITKKVWGNSSMDTEELTPLAGFCGPGNKFTLIKSAYEELAKS